MIVEDRLTKIDEGVDEDRWGDSVLLVYYIIPNPMTEMRWWNVNGLSKTVKNDLRSNCAQIVYVTNSLQIDVAKVS